MNLRDIHYFCVLAEEKHFGKAAAACFVSQPTLSMQLKKLENELNLTLFERKNKQVILTDAGNTLLPYAKGILSKERIFKQVSKQLTDPLAGTLSLSAIQSLAPYIFPSIIPAIMQNLPKLILRLHEGKTNDILQQLADGKLDLALAALPLPTKNLTTLSLFQEPFYVAMNSSHKLNSQTTPLTIEQLTQYPLLLLEEGHCLRHQALELCHGLPNSSNTYAAASLETLRYTVASGQDLTLMPLLACIATKDLAYKKIKNSSAQRDIALIFRDSDPRKKLYAEIASIIKACIAPKLHALQTQLND